MHQGRQDHLLPLRGGESRRAAGARQVVEPLKDWEACPIGRVRPHKDVLFRIYDSYRKGELAPLGDDDYRVIEGAAEVGEREESY